MQNGGLHQKSKLKRQMLEKKKMAESKTDQKFLTVQWGW
jgi:hypothetical protein